MIIVVLVGGGVVGLIGLFAVPMLLRWPSRLRWIIASSAVVDPWLGMPALSLRIDQVQVMAAPCTPGDAVWIVDDAGEPCRLLRASRDPTDREWLERWSDAKTPLLRLVDIDGTTSLHGPTYSIAGLRPVTPTQIF